MEGLHIRLSAGLPGRVRAPAGLTRRPVRVRPGALARDLMAPIAAGVTLVLVDATAVAFPGGGAFLLLLVPVIACLVLCGRRPAFIALVLGGGGALLLVPIRGHPWLSDPVDLTLVGLYLCVGASIVVAAGELPHDRTRRRTVAAIPVGRPSRIEPVEALTPRELDVLRMAAQGRSVEEIGRQLYLSRNTVKSHLAHAYGKLGAHNRTQALVAGLSAGLLDPAALHDAD